MEREENEMETGRDREDGREEWEQRIGYGRIKINSRGEIRIKRY